MIDQKNIKQAMGVDVSLSSEMINALTIWTLIYENKAAWLKPDIIHSMNLGAAIASEISRTSTIEMTVELGKTKRAKFLIEQFEPLMDKMRESIEYGCAKGGLIFKPYVNGENISIDIVHADHFYPLNFDGSGNMTSVIFVDQRQKGRYYYTRLERHDSQFKSDEGQKGYLVENKAFRSETRESLGEAVLLNSIDDWVGLAESAIIKNVEIPLFAYFKYSMANNIDPLSPLGVSCYSRATDLIKEADKQWSRILWEMESGERALYVDELAFARDEEGKPRLPNKRLIRTLESGTEESDLFEDWTPEIRIGELSEGLDSILKRIEFTCGLASGTLSDPNTVDKTATEIKISKQRTAATIADTQKAIAKALDQLFEAMDTWATLSNLSPKGKITPVYRFDDSIIVDKDTQFQQDLRLLDRIIGRVEFRMRNFNEDEKTATEKINIVLAESKKQSQSMFSDEQEVNA